MNELVEQQPTPKLRGYYWKEGHCLGNLGEALMPLLVGALGYKLVSQSTVDAEVVNADRCLLVIGSLLDHASLAGFTTPLDIWGCGWRGTRPPVTLLAQARIYAVRGPQTAAGLGLPPDIPLGDPALLLPRLVRRHSPSHGRPMVIPHIHRTWQLTAQQRCHLTGCAEVLPTRVIQTLRPSYIGWRRQMVELIKGWLSRGIQLYRPWAAVDRIAGAGFVLTGSLHGAILAQAYGIPWAAYDDGYVDVPPKWLDWAAYLNIRLDFVKTLAEGQQWWQRVGRYGALRDLTPLLEAFPYPLPNPRLRSHLC